MDASLTPRPRKRNCRTGSWASSSASAMWTTPTAVTAAPARMRVREGAVRPGQMAAAWTAMLWSIPASSERAEGLWLQYSSYVWRAVCHCVELCN
jgi:hypothetical protein